MAAKPTSRTRARSAATLAVDAGATNNGSMPFALRSRKDSAIHLLSAVPDRNSFSAANLSSSFSSSFISGRKRAASDLSGMVVTTLAGPPCWSAAVMAIAGTRSLATNRPGQRPGRERQASNTASACFDHFGDRIPSLFTTSWGNSQPAEIGRYKSPMEPIKLQGGKKSLQLVEL